PLADRIYLFSLLVIVRKDLLYHSLQPPMQNESISCSRYFVRPDGLGYHQAFNDPAIGNPMARKIAIVEDEQAIADNYRDALQKLVYKVSHYLNRPDALAAFATNLPDLAIIDVGLGDDIEGGFELCRELRSRSPELPIVFLTARDDEFDVISGLRLGADDYLTKDIGQAHMLARINALFRRIDALRQPVKQEDTLERGPLIINISRMSTHR